MAAPTHTALPTAAGLQAAGGIQLPNGFRGVLVFNRMPLCFFWTQKLQPGKIDGGAPIDQSTMLNLAVKTKLPRFLREEGDSKVIAAYDPFFRSQIRANLVNQNGSVTEWLADGSYEDYYGFMYSAEFSEFADGELPLVTFMICKSNYDPVGKVEVPPVFVSVSGT